MCGGGGGGRGAWLDLADLLCLIQFQLPSFKSLNIVFRDLFDLWEQVCVWGGGAKPRPSRPSVHFNSNPRPVSHWALCKTQGGCHHMGPSYALVLDVCIDHAGQNHKLIMEGVGGAGFGSHPSHPTVVRFSHWRGGPKMLADFPPPPTPTPPSPLDLSPASHPYRIVWLPIYGT